MNPQQFSSKLIAWYEQHQRDLPWRHTYDPYQIWLSEIILQQTRVVQGLPYYYKFTEAFPTVQALANADEKEVLRFWQGLGYYSRARNLHLTAKVITEQYGGKFPNTYAELIKLKGIGAYTAAAIASFAFSEKVAVLDGNVYRVLARMFGVETDITAHEAKKVFGQLANQLIPSEKPDLYNQAIMEFGAVQCVPVSPQCMFCPFAFDCVANATGRQATLPIKSKKTKVRERFFNYFVIEQDMKLAMKERLGKDVWAGMFDFFLVEANDTQSLDKLVINPELAQILQGSTVQPVVLSYTHVLTHQRIQTKFWHLKINTDVSLPLPLGLQFYTLDEVDTLPKSTLVNNYLKEYFF